MAECNLRFVADVWQHLAGSWQLERHISENNQNKAVFTGNAVFSLVADDTAFLHYLETGHMHLLEGQALQATRSYLYHFNGLELSVFFDEKPLRLFHVLMFDATASRAEGFHACGDDRYQIYYQFYDFTAFFMRHVVQGPRKNYVMESYLRKV